MNTVQQDLVDKIAGFLRTILVSNGFDTNIGEKVFVHLPVEVQVSRLPCCTVADTVSTWKWMNGLKYARESSVQVVGLVSAGQDAAKTARMCESDLVRALWNSGDRTYGGLCANCEIVETEIIVMQEKETVAGARAELVLTYDHLVKSSKEG